jgi:hypothetical protein
MHWMSLPVTRGEWSAMMRETLHKAEAGSTAGQDNGQDNGQDTRQEERP